MRSLLNFLHRKSGDMSARSSDMRAKSGDMAAESSDFSGKSSDMAGEFSDFSEKSSDIGPEFNDFSPKSGDFHAEFNDSVGKSSNIAAEFSDFSAKFDDIGTEFGDFSEMSGDMAARSSDSSHAAGAGGEALGGMANIAATKGFNASSVHGAGGSSTGQKGDCKRSKRSFFLGWRIWSWFAGFFAAKEPTRRVYRRDVHFDELFVIEYVVEQDWVRVHDGIIPDVHDLLKHIPFSREVPRFDRFMMVAVLLALAKRVLGLVDGIAPQRLEVAHALSRRAVLERWDPRGPPRSPLFWNVR